MNKLDEVKEIIGDGLEFGQADKKTIKKVNDFIDCVESSYCLIQWPDVQDYMEEEWFDKEAILTDNSGYFIPLKRIFN